jgi:ankyrin repeat protein
MPNHKETDFMPSLDLVKALLRRGANPNATLVKALPGRSGMDAGDTTLGPGTTPLMRAARAGDSETMRMLVAKGADPNLTTKDGTNALQFAAGVGYRDKNTKGSESEALDALKLAVSLGMDLNRENTQGETALHGAAGRGADTIVQYLVEHSAKLDAKTKRGLTPLDYAEGKNVVAQLPVPHDSTVELLRKLGAPEGKAQAPPAMPAK